MTASRIAPIALTPHDATDHSSVTYSTLKKWRVNGDGPRYAKIGKAVRYRVEDLNEWLAKQLAG